LEADFFTVVHLTIYANRRSLISEDVSFQRTLSEQEHGMVGVFGKRGIQPRPVQHVIGREHHHFLKSIGIDPDGPENVIPSQQDIDERLAKGRAGLDRRLEQVHKNLAARVGPEIRMRPFFLIPESCWQEETGAFLMKFLDFSPHDSWNTAFLPADQLTSAIMNAPLHPGIEIPVFADAAKKFIAECTSRVAEAAMKAGQTGEFQLVTAAKIEAKNMIIALAMTFAEKLLEAHKATKSK
jgi:hypothetical protein